MAGDTPRVKRVKCFITDPSSAGVSPIIPPQGTKPGACVELVHPTGPKSPRCPDTNLPL
jgi:hypothetical protein